MKMVGQTAKRGMGGEDLPVTDEGVLLVMDTPDDYERLRRLHAMDQG